jgi:hypothetical protein
MTQQDGIRAGRAVVAAIAVLALIGCNDDDDNRSSTATPTVSATRTVTRTPIAPPATASPTQTAQPTATTPPGAAVAGLIVVNQDVGSGERDNLSPLPPEALPPVGKGFDRGLGNADWTIDDADLRGTTTGDGRFSISGLAPGRHLLRVSKTVDGNLLEFVVPIVVGDDGAAEVVAEVSWGLVRATSEYTEGGAAMRAVFAPNGTWLITRAGRTVELSDGFRTFADADGDGHFDPTGSCEEFYACDANGGCGSPERICMCIPSCPDCEDCGQRACIPRSYFHRPDCGPDGLCKPLPYRCGEGQECVTPGDQCTCISSCLGCDNCVASACASPCDPGQPIDIVRIDVFGATRVVVGQDANASAVATFSDGTSVDVTWLATWASSDPSVATVDTWGRLTTLAAGTSDITAALGETVSAPLQLTVVERPTLLRIHLQNASCYYPLDDRLPPPVGGPRPPVADAAFLPPPLCGRAVRIGGTIQFTALGEFDTGYYEDITDEVEWHLEGDDVGEVVAGLFTASQAGEASLRAALAGIESDAQSIKVVTEATVESLSIYPGNYAYPYIDGGPVHDAAADAPCFECGYFLTLLRGDSLMFSATAHYDTGEWEDVTNRVSWRSSDATVASIDTSGLLTAVGAGEAAIDASLDGVTSAPVSTRVVNEATLTSIFAYQDSQDRALGVGEEIVFHAVGYYDIGISRDVTNEVAWRSSDETVGGFDSPGVFTGRGAGTVTVWAELGGQQSPPLPLEVYARSELDYCDPTDVNRGSWSDDFNRVTLESDCEAYTPPDIVELRFTVTEMQRPGGIFDPCLDLYAYRGSDLVRTIREEGCGDPFVAAGAPDRDEAALKYQLKAFWDLKDEHGDTVSPGVYTIRGRFYLYYDPIVEIDVTVNGPAS